VRCRRAWEGADRPDVNEICGADHSRRRLRGVTARELRTPARLASDRDVDPRQVLAAPRAHVNSHVIVSIVFLRVLLDVLPGVPPLSASGATKGSWRSSGPRPISGSARGPPPEVAAAQDAFLERLFGSPGWTAPFERFLVRDSVADVPRIAQFMRALVARPARMQ
jgi:hypothetical protein